MFVESDLSEAKEGNATAGKAPAKIVSFFKD
jgi:hypothetical protein